MDKIFKLIYTANPILLQVYYSAYFTKATAYELRTVPIILQNGKQTFKQ